MPCDDCEESGTILRTKGSWLLDTTDEYRVFIEYRRDNGRDYLKQFDSLSQEEAERLVVNVLIAMRTPALSRAWVDEQCDQAGVIKRVDGMFRKRTLVEKIMVSGIPYEEQAPA